MGALLDLLPIQLEWLDCVPVRDHSQTTSPLFSEFMRGYLPLSPHVSSGLMTPWGDVVSLANSPPTPSRPPVLPSTYLCIIWVSYCSYFDRDSDDFETNLCRLDTDQCKLDVGGKVGRSDAVPTKMKWNLHYFWNAKG